MANCKICGNGLNNTTYILQERMFGYKDEFEYMQCGNCGCLQIASIPENLDKYYPRDQYFSFINNNAVNYPALSKLFRRIQSNYLLFGKNKFLGSLLCLGYQVPDYYEWLKKVKAGFNSSILDIGCGSGELLFQLQRLGFKNLTGTDPFIENDIFENDVKIYKKNIYELDGEYDFVMMNHAFEHMDNPLGVLKRAYELLKPGSYLLVRIPVIESYCWQHYGVYWAPLDAPRHFYIHSLKSMELLSEQAGFEIKGMIHDGTALQFWGSEQYKKDISLMAENSYNINKHKSIFTKAQMNQFKKRIKDLNSSKMGGDAAFYLYKP